MTRAFARVAAAARRRVERLRLDRVMSIDDSMHGDDTDEHATARRFRSLIRAGSESPMTGTLDRAYFVNLERKLREGAAKS